MRTRSAHAPNGDPQNAFVLSPAQKCAENWPHRIPGATCSENGAKSSERSNNSQASGRKRRVSGRAGKLVPQFAIQNILHLIAPRTPSQNRDKPVWRVVETLHRV